MGTAPDCERWMSTGCSSLQPPHHDAQKLSSQTLPLRSFDEITFPGSWSCGSEKSGAGFPTNGEGNSRGLSVSPTARKPTTTTKSPNGMRNRFMRLSGGPSVSPQAQQPLCGATRADSVDH